MFTSLLFSPSFISAQEKIIIRHMPNMPLKEEINFKSFLNFDFIIQNLISDTIKLEKITVSFLDKQNRLLQQKFLDNNGSAPSIMTLPNIQWNGVGETIVFNPFPEILYKETYKLVYSFTFIDTKDSEFEVHHSVIPVEYKQPISLILPLKKTIMVYDGHDFYSHHRRFDTELQLIKDLGITSNFMRYAYDLIVVDGIGKSFNNDGKNDKDWFSWETEIYSVADGTVAAITYSKLDNKEFKTEDLRNNPLALFGNYVAIKHSNKLYSIYGHLRQNSSSNLKIGDTIKQGQRIGAIGVSGSSMFPHLHFEVQNGLKHGAEGLPSYFSNFSFVIGAKTQKVTNSTINTGDFIRAN